MVVLLLCSFWCSGKALGYPPKEVVGSSPVGGKYFLFFKFSIFWVFPVFWKVWLCRLD
ncbi:unnamed protein product [Meloidogyne enterolobii]|uniref:Uncharacterized protein n=1 Tax=Meloidogyne enterolobii TaxID=390850 RepID=A0ACB1AHG0_MELEN